MLGALIMAYPAMGVDQNALTMPENVANIVQKSFDKGLFSLIFSSSGQFITNNLQFSVAFLESGWYPAEMRMVLSLKGGVAMAGYQTQQRKALVDFLSRHPGQALTAQALCQALKEDRTAHPIGDSTVYRLLQKLAAEGVIKRYLLEGSRCYVYEMPLQGDHCGGHLHIKCTLCHKLIHLGEEETTSVMREAEKEGFALDREQTLLLGQCAACREGEQ